MSDVRAHRIRRARVGDAAVAAVRLVAVLPPALYAAAPAWHAAVPGAPQQPSSGEESASNRVAVVAVTIVVACVVVFVSWGVAARRSRRSRRREHGTGG